ncbi:MAG: PEGA domain-containing protein [Candidatus Levybacteria bacterium]|nr:PEGA domain-containing protein [Candidatus Levybacteria bacterium]
MKRVVISTLLILLLILVGTGVGIYYARGYRFDPQNPKAILQGTGLLVLTSRPDGARVYVDDTLTTATNNTINLQPGTYNVRIEKDGYFAWKKTIEVKKETVSQANATLFPIAPRLESITTTGALGPVLDGTGSLIAYTVSSASADKNGIYTINMSTPAILPLGGGANQIANDLTASFSTATLSFSPDGTELIASVSSALSQPTAYLLQARSFNSNPQNITATLNEILAEWKTQQELKDQKLIDSLPKKIRTVANNYFGMPVLSPEEDKILYTASASATLPILISPRLPGTNSTPEARAIQEGNTYVYDMKEDRNYLVAEKDDAPEKFLWHPDSDHLVYIKGSNINVVEFDGGNLTTVYAGPFVNGFVFPWPNGSSLVILTNLNIPGAPYNLYRISLR